MKKVTTKVVLLMLVIPLLLILAINTTINVTSVMVDIPVTSVSIEGDKVLFVDVLSDDNIVRLNTIVNPKEATNKGVTYSVESVGDEKIANVSISNKYSYLSSSGNSDYFDFHGIYNPFYVCSNHNCHYNCRLRVIQMEQP